MIVSVVMGSKSDDVVMHQACAILEEFGVKYEKKVVSAHRTPFEMVEYARNLVERGVGVVIAGAGGAAHLPGMISSMTPLPVIGVPIQSKALQGIDSLLSIVQMPAGVPVLTMAINGAKNAGYAAVEILSLSDPVLRKQYQLYKEKLASKTWMEQFSNDE